MAAINRRLADRLSDRLGTAIDAVSGEPMDRWTNKATRATRAVTSALLLAALVAPTVAAADRDHDGLRDGFEAKYGVTSPDRQDSDWDGVVDSAEDNDGDNLSNLGEQRFGTNPGKRDSDGDGKSDGAEDHDHDGRSNAREQDQRPLPSGLKPSLRAAPGDSAQRARGCDSPQGMSKLVRCKFGKVGASTRMILMGDSHAQMFADPIARTAESEGRRLVTMLKGGCPPVLAIMSYGQYVEDRGRTCREWRRKAIDAINANPPDLVIILASESYKLADDKGRIIPKEKRPPLWRKGMERMINMLPPTTEILVLGDVPQNWKHPVRCLRESPNDMSRCASRRQSLKQRGVEKALRAAVAGHGEQFRTLYGKICTYDPCPVVQGKALVFRDKSHLTATFARRLTPSLRKMIRNILD